MSREQYQARGFTDPDTRIIGILIFMELHRRILHGEFGAIPEPIKDWAFTEGGYCLDAPDNLPAGACEFYDLDPTDMEDELDEWGHWGMPVQIMVPREPCAEA